MITLYTFGPNFGLPDPSPFVLKTMLQLKFAGLPFREDRGGFFKAPKRKLPYIDDDGVKIADSCFIRFHIEKKYGFDFDAGLTAEQRATAWAVERMCEDHLYFALIDVRWRDEANFAKGAANFFDALPGPVRPLIRRSVRRKVMQTLYLQGTGRHSPQEVAELACRDIDALAVLLADKPFLMAEKPCSADAAVWAMLAGLLVPPLDSPGRQALRSRANLVAYTLRLAGTYFGALEGAGVDVPAKAQLPAAAS
jgi:glutathione S-transferase